MSTLVHVLVFETHFLGVFVVDFFEGVNDVKDLVLGVAKLFERAERIVASSLLRCGYLLRVWVVLCLSGDHWSQ